MGADFTSPTIDFRDSSHASVQIVWAGADLFTGSFKLYGSLLRDDSSFNDNDIDHSLYVNIDADAANASDDFSVCNLLHECFDDIPERNVHQQC